MSEDTEEHRKVLHRSKPKLVELISIAGQLYSNLESYGILNHVTIENIKGESNEYKQKEKLLDEIIKRPKEHFDNFCQALIDDEQSHIVDDYLHPFEGRQGTRRTRSGAKRKLTPSSSTCSMVPPREDHKQLTQLQQSLAEMYLRTYTNIQRNPLDEGDTMNIDDVFVELSLVEEVHKPSKTERKKLDSFQDALKPNENGVRPTRVIARGKAGSGKTTLVSKIAVDWARMILSPDGGKRKTIMQNYKLLLIVNLREVQKDASLHSVLQSQIFEQSDKVSNILNYMEKKPKTVIMLLDGYDEYNDSLCTELSNIIKSFALRDVCVVVTTRPWKAEELCLKRQSYVHVEITGLSVQNVKKYIARFFGIDEAKLKFWFDLIFNEPASESSEPNERNAQQLFDYVESNGMLSDGVLPLILLFTCLLWQDRSGENMPDTQVHLYREIVDLIVRRYCEHPSNTNNTELHSIIESYFEPLGKIALKGLLSPERGLLFDAKRIKEILNDDDDHVYKSGLLTKVKDRNKLNL